MRAEEATHDDVVMIDQLQLSAERPRKSFVLLKILNPSNVELPKTLIKNFTRFTPQL